MNLTFEVKKRLKVNGEAPMKFMKMGIKFLKETSINANFILRQGNRGFLFLMLLWVQRKEKSRLIKLLKFI